MIYLSYLRYVLSMDDVEDQKQYLMDMLDPSQADHNSFVEEFLQRIGAGQGQPRGITAYRKKKDQDQYVTANNNNNKAKQTPSPAKDAATTAKQGKTKYVSLYSADGAAKDIVTLKGRHPCQCQAAKHKLVNNCTSCGKIVCEQEGKIK